MKYISFPTLVFGFSLLAVSCSPADEAVSTSKEAIDANSNLAKLKVSEAPSYQDIAKKTSVKNPTLPWTDSYWPLNEKSLARRWTKGDQKIGLAQYFESQTAKSKESKVDPMLSPADKYDILYRWRHNKVIDAAKNTELMKDWAELENTLDLAAEVSVVRGQVRNAYTKLYSEEMKELRSQFPLSVNSWNDYLSYSTNETYNLLGIENSGEDWSWMGSCHGWAAAALMEETPKQSVLVKFDEQEVLMTEGDVRGLLTKAWADRSPDQEQYFLGRRCNDNVAEAEGKIPAGEAGKGYYGEITRGDKVQGFYVSAELYLPSLKPSQRVYPVNYGDNDSIQGYLLETYARRGSSYVMAKDLASLEKFLKDADQSVVESISKVKMFGCWDINPASFHVALLEKIGKEGTGLVMDRTRTGQVWNQPVFAADFQIGELTKVWDAPLSNKRAAGTKYLATVTTTVKWVSEPSRPRMSYSKEFDESHVSDSTYTYVLEFDRNQRLIGGEWGTLDRTDPAQVTPDFIYGFTKASKPVDKVEEGFDYSGIIAAIHKCSLADESDGEYEVEGKTYKYKTCALSKVAP